ncbi:MAG: murein biosynthesis integral membrane protein MurJ [Myxococcota bacterium]|nr:murein biosynthesis integral membrane protein MurJ [Myxococcota bacterium]
MSTEPTPKSDSGDVGRNALVTGAASLIVRLSGLIREVVFAAFFGAGMAADAYNAAFRAAQFFRELVAEGSLSNAYVPIFSEIAEKDGLKEAWRLANAFLGVLLVVLGGLTLVTFFFAEGWVWLLASGFATDPEKFALATNLTRVLSPFVAAMSLAAVFMGMLNVRGKFFLPAVAPAMFNVAVIVGCLGSEWFEATTGHPAIVMVGLASVVGGAGQFLVQLPALRADGFRFRPRLEKHPALMKMVKFLIPAFIAIMTVQFNLLVESQIASRFGDGPVSYLFYAFRLVQLPLAVVAGSVAVAALVSLSALMARGAKDRLAGEISDALVLNSFLVVPAGVGLFLLAEPIIRLMFERGAFTPADTAATAMMLKMYTLAIWGIATHRVAIPCYYALGDPFFPMRIAVVLMLAKLPVALAIVYPLGFGYTGLPLSHALLVMIECAVLFWGFTRRAGAFPRRMWTDHARIVIAAAVMGGAVYLMLPWADGLSVFLVSAAGAVVYFVTSFALGLSAARKVLDRFMKKKGLPPTIDPQTRLALEALSGSAVGSIVIEDGTLGVRCADGTFRFRARDGVISGERTGDGEGMGAALTIGAVMRVGHGPPMLHGLLLGERSFRAEGEVISEGRAPGPVLPVERPEA